MTLQSNDACMLEVEDYDLYEEASGHAFARDKSLLTGGKTMEAEKRIRREIANSNERRRMQSINAGFQALRTLLPRHEGEKLSKAAILQQTAEYIYSLEQEKTRLLSQNCQLKRLLNQHEGGEIPLKKRKTEVISQLSTIIPDSTDDTMTNSRSPEHVSVLNTMLTKDIETGDLRAQLERERVLRKLLEDRLHTLETQLYTDTGNEIPHTTIQYDQTEVVECKVENDDVEITNADVPAAPILEAVIKAEPRVEVEALPDAKHDGPTHLVLSTSSTHLTSMHLASTSRQNLETIVEAIRHLEGDHLFREEASEAPLALTKKVDRPPPTRPGVIVVKHS